MTLRWIVFVLALALGAEARAQSVPAAPDLQPMALRAAQLFSPEIFTAADGPLRTHCDVGQFYFQAIAMVIVAGALMNRLRYERTSMEGVASTLILVAFIATVPLWMQRTLDSGDMLADAVGYQSVTNANTPAPVMQDLWQLVGQWAPPGTPYLDALQDQSATTAPASGTEQSWGLQAWNWARGVGAADAATFSTMWQATSGGLRAVLLFGGCALEVAALSAVIVLMYLSEIVRYLLFYGAGALLPLFIAGLALESLRGQAIKAILGTASLALWPVGWALAHIVTHVIAQGLANWMADVSRHALAGAGLPTTSFAVAAPYLGWAVYFVFCGATVALAMWVLAATWYAPVLITRALSTGVAAAARVMDGMTPVPPVPLRVSASTASQTVATPRAAPAPAAREQQPPPPRVPAARLRALTPAAAPTPTTRRYTLPGRN